MPEHTPGPWEISGQHIVGGDDIHVRGKKRNSLGISSASYSNYVCHIHGNQKLPGPRANARLIAAAPEMLETCEAAVKGSLLPMVGEPERNSCHHCAAINSHQAHCIFARLHAAIAKARGEEASDG